MSSWGEYYGQIAGAMALYRESNRRLVELADLRPGMRVLDLAGGAGLTSRAILAAVPDGLELHLLDSDESMLAAARASLGDRVAGYHLADAAQVKDLFPAGAPLFDRVLCNLSFFSFREPEAVLRALQDLVKPVGQLLFSLQNTTFNTGGDLVSPYWALQTALAQTGELERAPLTPDRLPNQRSIEGTLLASGWKPMSYTLQELGDDPAELHGQLQLFPLPLAERFHTAVARSIDRAEGLRESITGQWRVVHFQAQPAADPLKALQAKA
ncbi:MAG TPA: methyltransferase, partial [Symbiobacteriaceae bacterium]|nr:methyltransferase [Symbiobacteriaceae bacterium]